MRVLLFLMLLCGPAFADVSGPLRVIDGDTFDVGGERIRLFGVDAPEHGQPCTQPNGSIMDCGEWVSDQIAAQFEGRQTVCIGRERDRYDRLVATCTIEGVDLGREIVASGLARAFLFYSEDYAADEKSAAVAGRGIWQFTLASPASYRARDVSPPPSGCDIKGNISKNGHIYHMPHSRDYQRTRINEDQGERWFCSESLAQQAGWRPAQN